MHDAETTKTSESRDQDETAMCKKRLETVSRLVFETDTTTLTTTVCLFDYRGACDI